MIINNEPPLLETRGLSKSFRSTQALSKVDFSLQAGEVHALLGENGAGKSTLIKLVSGIHPRDEGTILLEGREVSPRSPRHALEMGISAVYQEVDLVPTLSVAENIFLGRQPTFLGVVNMPAANRKARQLLKTFDIDIDVTRDLSAYSIAIQQIVAIMRGIDLSAKVLILDEPTSSLDRHEVDILFSIIRSLKERGVGILLITHFLDLVYEISDRITVLRNGHLVGVHKTGELPRVQLISEMLGKELVTIKQVESDGAAPEIVPEYTTADIIGERPDHISGNGAKFLQVQGFARRGMMEPFDLDVKQGEIVGLVGLLGSGRTETAHLIFGIKKSEKGEAYINGKRANLSSPRETIQHGFGLCPEDRKVEGIIGDLTVRENIILALQAKMGWFDHLSRKKQEQLAQEMIDALRIITPGTETPVKDLSGGNQQKVILARWLVSNPDLLILDEPTRGIDVGAHVEIIEIIKKLAKEGKAMLIISSELSEIVDYSDRVVVLRDRQIIGELEGDQISQNTIMQMIAER